MPELLQLIGFKKHISPVLQLISYLRVEIQQEARRFGRRRKSSRAIVTRACGAVLCMAPNFIYQEFESMYAAQDPL